jgi:NADH:ubiquinone oxidoreductase subunit E
MYKSKIANELTQSAAEDDHIRDQIAELLSSYKGSEDELIPVLQDIQQKFGYLPEESMKQVAEYFKMKESSVFGVATFYSQFKLAPTGRNIIRVCRGTACHVRGGSRILMETAKQLGINPGESTDDLEYAFETAACFGACALSPVVVINNDVYGRMTVQKLRKILNELKEKTHQ